VNDHPGGLVEHEQRFILIDDIEADILGGESGVGGGGCRPDADLLAAPDFFRGIGDLSIECHLSRFDP